MKQLIIRLNCIIGIGLLLLLGCNNSTVPKHTDTSTSGKITIAVDESLKPIIEAEKEVFEALYPNAKLTIEYTNEIHAIQLLSKDSARIAIVSRELNEDEKAYFDKQKLVPRTIIIGYDAIALIMNKSRKDTILSLTQVKDLLTGNITNWQQLNKSNSNEEIQVVFDNAQSGAIRFLKDSLLEGKNPAKNCYAVKNNPLVIEQVEKNQNTIGIIGVSWISDLDDSLSTNFLQKIQVININPKNPETAEATTMKPYQAYIALKQYPLYRNIYIINPEGRYGLGTGFASFINSDKGQRIILKSGLVPAHAPIRIIQLNNK